MMKEKFSNYRATKKERAQNKWKGQYPVYLALDFLEPVDLVKLLELNKEYRQMFRKRVYRTIFNNFSQRIMTKQRSPIWTNLLEPVRILRIIDSLL